MPDGLHIGKTILVRSIGDLDDSPGERWIRKQRADEFLVVIPFVLRQLQNSVPRRRGGRQRSSESEFVELAMHGEGRVAVARSALL